MLLWLMAVLDIVNRTKLIIYGTGLGEKPAIRRAAADAAETTSGELITFDLLAGEGAKVAPGDVLAQQSAQNENSAFVFYVLSVSTDTVTCINGYHGAPAAAVSDLDGAVLEQRPLVTTYEIFEALDQVIAHLLYPEVYVLATGTIASPDLVDGQEAVVATAKEIIGAWQIIGDTTYRIPASLRPVDVDTTIASTGKMAEFDWIDGSTGYYTYKRPIVEGDDDNEEITTLIALGAAAIALGAAMSETAISVTKKDNIEAGSRRQAVANSIWRDFLTMKQGHARDLEDQTPHRIYIDRG